MNSEKPIVLVDVDGVLADFATPILEHCNRLTGRSLQYSDVTVFEMEKLYPELTFDQVFAPCIARGFCKNLEPIVGARAGIAQLRALGANVVAVTSPWWPSLFWHQERMLWLIERFGFNASEVIFSSKKELVRGNILVDDRAKHVVSWMDANKDSRSSYGVLWESPYNRNDELPGRGKRTNDWGFVAAAVNVLNNYGFIRG